MTSPREVEVEVGGEFVGGDEIVDEDRVVEESSLLGGEVLLGEDPTAERSSRALLLGCIILPALIGLSTFMWYERTTVSKKTGTTKERDVDVVAPTILISIDAFRHDYVDRMRGGRKLAPTLSRLAESGVRAYPGLQPVMPTKTFPNHWTLATGLYPEVHGIIDNTMYNQETQEWFHTSSQNPAWWGGEPIWESLRKTRRKVLRHGANGTMQEITTEENYTTACVFWVGCDIPNGHNADAFWTYDSGVSYERRVDRAVDLMMGDAEDLGRAAQFVALYFDRVDRQGHAHGPDSEQVDKEISAADTAIESLLSKLDRRLGRNRYNVIVVSDHGMSTIDEMHVIDLTTAFANNSVQDVRTTPLGNWLNVTTTATQVAATLAREFKRQGGHARSYEKADIPERWHLRESALVMPVVSVADIGWTVKFAHANAVPGAARQVSEGKVWHKGNHGFDNEEDDMQAILIAHGPAFRGSARISGLRSVDVYGLICDLFVATCNPHNGSAQISARALQPL